MARGMHAWKTGEYSPTFRMDSRHLNSTLFRKSYWQFYLIYRADFTALDPNFHDIPHGVTHSRVIINRAFISFKRSSIPG